MNKKGKIIIYFILKTFVIFVAGLFLFGFSAYALVNDNSESSVMREDAADYGSSNEKILKNILKSIFGKPGQNTTDTSASQNPSTSQNGTLETTSDPNYPDIANVPVPDTAKLLNNKDLNFPAGVIAAAKDCLKNEDLYEQLEKLEGIPLPIIAGMHYREGSCNPNQSLVGGRVIGQPEPDVKSCSSQDTGRCKPKALKQGGCGFDNWLDAGCYGLQHLKGKIGGKTPKTHQELVSALEKYNGTGNRNCGKSPYKFCPPAFDGDDHIYPFGNYPDEKHKDMYLIVPSDGKRDYTPKEYKGFGVLTVGNAIAQLIGEDL